MKVAITDSLTRLVENLLTAGVLSLILAQQEPGEETYVRENLALKLFHAIGVPASTALHIRLNQNGAFYGLYSLVEQVSPTSRSSAPMQELYVTTLGFMLVACIFSKAPPAFCHCLSLSRTH